MSDLVSRIRAWLGLSPKPDAEKSTVERVVNDQRQRLARLDAGMPVDRRRMALARHPARRAGDRP